MNIPALTLEVLIFVKKKEHYICVQSSVLSCKYDISFSLLLWASYLNDFHRFLN